MSGLGLVLSIAKDALAAQRYGMDVTGHNIANVNNPGYSRQSPVQVAKEPSLYGGLLLGRGVDTTQILRASDQFIESRLMQQKSSMSSLEQMENYIQVMEGLFNENSETSISAMLADFWNLWHDIANNPSGASERTALYEHSISLSEQFNTLNADLTQLETDLTNAVSAGIDEINQITEEIAELNNQIVGTEAVSIANDLRDMRNTLVSELSEYIYTKSFEQSSGSLTVLTARGCVLVHTNSSYDLELGGDNGDRVEWQASGDATVDITDYITNGKLGGWLDMRDEVIAKYKLDLDALAKEFVWVVNQQHSQGVGLQFFSSSVTGTYKTSSGLLSTLTYGNKIDYDKDFKMWIEDGSVIPATLSSVTVDMGISENPTSYGGNFNVADTTYTIVVTQGGTVSTGTDHIQFSWSESGGTSGTATLAVSSTSVTIDGNTLNFTADDVIVAGNTLKINTIAGGAPKPVGMVPTETDTANSILDTYTFTVASGSSGTIGTDTLQIGWSNSITSGTFTLDAATTTVTVDGMTLPFTAGDYLFAGDVFTITTDKNGTPTATLPSAWHWTLDSFKDQFNRQTPRVTASITSDNRLVFTASTNAHELSNFTYNTGVIEADTTITVNHAALTKATAVGTPFKLTRTDVDTWAISGDPGYSATLIPTGGDDEGFGVDLTGNGSADIMVSFANTPGNGYVEFDITAASGNYSFGFSDDTAQDSGLMAALGFNTFFKGSTAGGIAVSDTIAGSKDYIAAAQIDSDTGDFAVGDNTNALEIADLQYTSSNIAQWTCNRASAKSSANVAATVEGYYHSTVGSIGMKSASISRSKAFDEVMVNKLGEIRDSISAVSLDEEMTNIIKFQRAYAAAAKLISVSDEMLNTLLSIK